MTPRTLTGRVTKYDISNIFINGDLYFLPQDFRQSTRDKYPVGTIVTATIEKGSVKTIDAAKGTARDKFLKEEEAQRNAQSGGGSLPPTPLEEKLVKVGFKPPTKEEAEKNIAAAKAETDQRQKEHQDYIKEITAKEPKPEKPDEWGTEFDQFKALLSSVKRDGIPELLAYLTDKTDFFIAPSSTKYHDAVEGGLLHHSLEVYHNLIELSKIFKTDLPQDSLTLIALLHDVCKTNFYRLEKKQLPRKKENGDIAYDEFNRKIWDETLVWTIDDQFPLGHGEKSVIIVQRFIKLTDEEIMAIRWHMMAYDDVKGSYAGNLAITNASEKYRIIPLFHMADLAASFLERREQKKEEGKGANT